MGTGSYETRDNSGALFINQRKQTDNHPDRTGECVVGGKKYRVAGWVKTAKSGTKFMSLAFTPMEDDLDREQNRQRTSGGNGSNPDDLDDDIPF